MKKVQDTRGKLKGCFLTSAFPAFSSVQVPGPAPNLQAVSNTPSSVSLSWEKPLTGNGEIVTYKLYYTDKSIGKEQVRGGSLCVLSLIKHFGGKYDTLGQFFRGNLIRF